MQKRVGRLFLLLLLIWSVAVPFSQTNASSATTVYKVPIKGTVEKGLYQFLKRSFTEAENANADAIVLEIDTPGGLVDAADQIAKLFSESEIEIIAFVNNRALSAGAFIALYADKIYMTQSSTMGAAQVIEGDGNAADAKMHSAWLANMKKAAEYAGREPKYAIAMAEPNNDLHEFGAGDGKLLTLTANDALQVGYSNGTVNSFQEVLQEIGLENAEVISTKETVSEKITRIVTDPIVIPILLSIAGLGLVLELYSPGFGVPGTMALTSLGLFFYGHLIAGLANYETIILFIIGVGLVIAEFFLPHGIAGVLGAIAILGSIIMAGANPLNMAISVLIALGIAVIGMVIIMKFFGRKLHLLNKMVLMDSTDSESGYVSNINRLELLKRRAKTTTPLRPSGTVELDGERIDVVSEGSYIDKGKDVMIVKVEGSRIVVREIDEEEGNE